MNRSQRMIISALLDLAPDYVDARSAYVTDAVFRDQITRQADELVEWVKVAVKESEERDTAVRDAIDRLENPARWVTLGPVSLNPPLYDADPKLGPLQLPVREGGTG